MKVNEARRGAGRIVVAGIKERLEVVVVDECRRACDMKTMSER